MIIKKNTLEEFEKKVEQLEKQNLNDFYGVLFNLSKLNEKNKSDFQMNIALNVVSDLLKNSDMLYLFDDFDLLVIFESDNRNFLDKLIYQLRYLFSDDNLAFKLNKENSNFCSVFLLKFQLKELSNKITEKYKKTKETVVVESNNLKNQTIDIVENINNLDISKMIRSQSIYALDSKGKLNKLFTEIFISKLQFVEDLNLSRSNLESIYYIKYLSEILDIRFLDYLSANLNNIEFNNLNIPLSLKSSLSENFINFEKELEKNYLQKSIIDIDIAEVFADFSLFVYIRDYLKSKNYKTCLTVNDPNVLMQINRESLGFDLVKLSIDSFDLVDKDFLINMSSNLKNRVILCHCDEETQFEKGKEIGIGLFQGWHIEKLAKKIMAS